MNTLEARIEEIMSGAMAAVRQAVRAAGAVELVTWLHGEGTAQAPQPRRQASPAPATTPAARTARRGRGRPKGGKNPEGARAGRPPKNLPSMKDRILKLFAKHPHTFLALQEISKATGISPDNTKDALRDLRTTGQMIMVGDKRTARYGLVPSTNTNTTPPAPPSEPAVEEDNAPPTPPPAPAALPPAPASEPGPVADPHATAPAVTQTRTGAINAQAQRFFPKVNGQKWDVVDRTTMAAVLTGIGTRQAARSKAKDLNAHAAAAAG